jgi:hypothetical protein
VKKLVGFLLGSLLSISVAQAQIQIPGTDFTLTPVNGGTGGLVSVPIPGGAGLSVTVGTGSAAIPLQDIRSNPNAVNISTWDDWYNEVPLGFTFPFYGRNFTTSWAMTNGLVTFQNPATSGLGGACCEGVDLRTTTNSRYNYTIYGLHTDLYSWTNNQYYLRGTNEMTYGWYNSSQCCSSQGGNSFEIKINSAGLVDTRIAGAMVQYNRVTSGMAGDLSKGEFFQAYHGRGINIAPGSSNIFSWQALGGTGAVDLCLTNPLSSPSCPGYQAAYFSQQCSISALYNASCPGYAAAYFTQQCTANPLFDVNCPGYASAYLSYQCSINALYSTTCPGYEQAYLTQQCNISPLYSTQCSGYQQASTQCSANPLYASYCPAYSSATASCSANALYASYCPGYSSAQLVCSSNPLSNTLCSGYTTATNVCSANPLTYSYCPSYTTTLASCSTNPQSNTMCPGYNPNPQSNTASRSSNANTVSTEQPTTTVSSSGQVSTGVALISDSNVNQVVTRQSTSTDAAATSAPVNVVRQEPQAQQTAPTAPTAVAARQEQKQEQKTEQKQEQKAEDKPSGGSTQTAQSSQNSNESKPAAPTARQELQARREAAAKAEAVEKGKNLANDMGKAADMEQQKQIQNVVIQAMGFTPGFDAYGKAMVPDASGYKPFTVYNNQRTIDNRSALRMFGGTDNLHREMVDSQYNRGN